MSPDGTGSNPAILGSETPVYNNTPSLVQGKFGEALNFTGNVFATVLPSPSILTPNEVTIDAWVNVQAIKGGVAYNNIFIEAVRTTATLPTRLLGLAVNGLAPQNASMPAVGALRGYVVTPSGLNEIDTCSGASERYMGSRGFHPQHNHGNAHLHQRERTSRNRCLWNSQPSRLNTEPNRHLHRARLKNRN